MEIISIKSWNLISQTTLSDFDIKSNFFYFSIVKNDVAFNNLVSSPYSTEICYIISPLNCEPLFLYPNPIIPFYKIKIELSSLDIY